MDTFTTIWTILFIVFSILTFGAGYSIKNNDIAKAWILMIFGTGLFIWTVNEMIQQSQNVMNY